jgi:hypothetical protein
MILSFSSLLLFQSSTSTSASNNLLPFFPIPHLCEIRSHTFLRAQRARWLAAHVRRPNDSSS